MRSWTPSLASTALTWAFTVFSATPRARAISRLDRPWASSAEPSRSRLVGAVHPPQVTLAHQRTAAPDEQQVAVVHRADHAPAHRGRRPLQPAAPEHIARLAEAGSVALLSTSTRTLLCVLSW